MVSDWAEALAEESPLLMRMGKDAIYRQQDMPLADALVFLRAQLTLATSAEDMCEGVAAFFDGREPNGANAEQACRPAVVCHGPTRDPCVGGAP